MITSLHAESRATSWMKPSTESRSELEERVSQIILRGLPIPKVLINQCYNLRIDILSLQRRLGI